MKKYSYLLFLFIFISCSQNRSYKLENISSSDYRLESEQNIKNVIEENDAIFVDFYQISNRKYFNWDFYIRSNKPIQKLNIEKLEVEYLDKKITSNLDTELNLINEKIEIHKFSESETFQTYYYAYFYMLKKPNNNILRMLLKEKNSIIPITVTVFYSINGGNTKKVKLDYLAKEYLRNKAFPEWAEE